MLHRPPRNKLTYLPEATNELIAARIAHDMPAPSGLKPRINDAAHLLEYSARISDLIASISHTDYITLRLRNTTREAGISAYRRIHIAEDVSPENLNTSLIPIHPNALEFTDFRLQLYGPYTPLRYSNLRVSFAREKILTDPLSTYYAQYRF